MEKIKEKKVVKEEKDSKDDKKKYDKKLHEYLTNIGYCCGC